jgi:tetratricopeptide (TPR) repeat protein
MRKLILFIIILCSVTTAFSQNKNIKKAVKYFENKDYEMARQHIDEAVSNPATAKDAFAWYLRGQVCHKLAFKSPDNDDLISASVRSFKKALDFGYDKSKIHIGIFGLQTIYYKRGSDLYNAKNFNRAMQDFYQGYKIGLDFEIDDLTSLHSALLSASQTGNSNKVVEYAEILHQGNFDSENVYIIGAKAYANLGEQEKAANMIRAGHTKYPGSYSLLLAELNVYLGKGENEKALPLIREAIEKDPKNPQLFFAIGTILEQMEGFRFEAENAYKKAIELKPDYFDAYYNLAVSYFNSAIEIMNQANETPLNNKTEYNALVRQSNKEFEIAMPNLEKAYEINPEDAGLNSALAQLYERLKLKDKKAALNNHTLLALIQREAVNQAPEIIITSPSNSRGFKILNPHQISSPSLTIAGQAIDEDGIHEIRVNGKKVTFDKDGYFSVQPVLKDGKNTVTVLAVDNKFKESKIDLYFEKSIKQSKVEAARLPESKVTYHAILIAVNDYASNAIKDLDNPIKDAQRFYNVIVEHYTFDPDNITFLKNPTRDELYNVFEEYMNLVDEDDNLLIFYAGHGHWDEEMGRGYWLPSDANADRRSSWFANGDLTGYIKSFKSKHTLLISDACFSGSIFKTRSAFDIIPKDIKILSKMQSRTAITSGTLTEVPDKSVFIEYMVKRLDQNTEKYLTTEGLFNSFRRAVISNSVTDQVPQYGSIHLTDDEGGEFIFIRK